MNIGQVAQMSGISPKMIRHYEQLGLITVAGRSVAGYRQYAESDLHILRFIRRARDLGFSLARIKQLLSLWQDQARQSAEVKQLAGQYIDELNVQITSLIAIRDQLQHLSQACHGNDRADCPIIEDLAGPAEFANALPP
ncbi:Cu(I)-responsive transcriptional regulator [Undibacterium danionis]|uniref:Cu(I)-responsive transcriptional regulator n=1 Tax=Undibacterium danionis TaxID=1812100 RepID=A0ABV6IG15_9BURK